MKAFFSTLVFAMIYPTIAFGQTEQISAMPKGVLALIVAGGAVLAMLGGVWLVFDRLKQKDQGFGPNSLKALGLVLFVPALLMVAVTVPDFQSETLAALLGTVAGYVLSHSKAEDK